MQKNRLAEKRKAAYGLKVARVCAEALGKLADALDGEGRLAERLQGDAHELHGVIVGGDSVGRKRTAAAAAMDDCPLAVFAHPNRDGVHNSAAVGLAVAGFNVNVQAAKAVWAMVAVVAARTLRNYLAPADLAGENLLAGVVFVVAFFKFFLFVFAVHIFLRMGDSV